MHPTLTSRVNFITILAAGAVALGLAAVAWKDAFSVLLCGGVCGVAVGVLQAKAIRQAPEQFAAAATALEVRAALTSTAPGKFAVALQWASVIPIVFLWSRHNFLPALAPVAGYAALMCVRDIISLPTVRRLSS